MNQIKDNILYLSIILFLFLLVYEKFPILAYIATLLLWYNKTKDKSILFVCILLLTFLIPRYDLSYPTMQTGTVTKVSNRYSILTNGNQSILVYTNQPLLYDSQYTITGEFQEIQSTPGFYTFDFQTYARKHGYAYQTTEQNIKLLKTGHSFRTFLQQSINDSPNKEILSKLLLNYTEESDQDAWYTTHGFTYAGMIVLLNQLLKYFLIKKHRDKLILFMIIIFCMIYRFPLLLVTLLMQKLLSYTKLTNKQKTGFVTTIAMILYPTEITSITFLLPCIFRYSGLFLSEQKEKQFFLSSLTQSILFHQVQPIQSICYPILQKLYGFLWIIAFMDTIFHTTMISLCNPLLTCLHQFLNLFVIKGSCIGTGTIFFLLLILTFRSYKHAFRIINVIFYLFLLSGFFHPFASFTVINVGQGDSLLLRMPFNSTNVLIDTGKPSALSKVQTYLDAIGVKHLDGLIITHADEDHSGNREVIAEQYKPDVIIDSHETDYDIGLLHFYDLNERKVEDENQSSIVNYVKLNGLTYLLTGDLDEEGEKEILKRYPQLQCDILKNGHHGSKTSTSDKLLDTIQPKLSLISSGAYSIYHHPSPETIQKLLKRHIPYFDTKEEGDMLILCLPFTNLFLTASGKVALL